jgi:hypothetical protein
MSLIFKGGLKLHLPQLCKNQSNTTGRFLDAIKRTGKRANNYSKFEKFESYEGEMIKKIENILESTMKVIKK